MPYGVDPSDAMMMARTMWGENTQADPDEYTAMANVMRNRLLSGDSSYGGNTMPKILLAKNQFQAWNDPTAPNYPMKAPLDSPAFQSAYQAASNVMSGMDKDPTGGAVNYYNPKAVSKTPSFAAGREGLPIGQHVFYGPQSGIAPEDQAVIDKLYPAQKSQQGGAGDLTDEDKAVIEKLYPSEKTAEAEAPSETNARVAGEFEQLHPHGPYDPLTPYSAREPGLKEGGGLSSETLAQLIGVPVGGAAAFGAAKVLPSLLTKGVPAALKIGAVGTIAGLIQKFGSEAIGPENSAKLMDLVRHAIHYSAE